MMRDMMSVLLEGALDEELNEEYYKGRCYHERSLNSNEGWDSIGCQSFMNRPILKYSNEIRSAVLIIHGEKAHSYYFGKDAYEAMIKNSKYAANKELLIFENVNIQIDTDWKLGFVGRNGKSGFVETEKMTS